jgi:hypothetical protein
MPRLLCALLLSMACSASRTATRPVNARLTMAPRKEQHCLLTWANKDAYCAVLGHARAAFTESAARISTPGVAPQLSLVLTVENALFYEQARGGLTFDLRVKVDIKSPDGELLDTLHCNGDAPTFDTKGIQRASVEAGLAAARDFERRYSSSDAIATWLASR